MSERHAGPLRDMQMTPWLGTAKHFPRCPSRCTKPQTPPDLEKAGYLCRLWSPSPWDEDSNSERPRKKSQVREWAGAGLPRVLSAHSTPLQVPRAISNTKCPRLGAEMGADPGNPHSTPTAPHTMASLLTDLTRQWGGISYREFPKVPSFPE